MLLKGETIIDDISPSVAKSSIERYENADGTGEIELRLTMNEGIRFSSMEAKDRLDDLMGNRTDNETPKLINYVIDEMPPAGRSGFSEKCLSITSGSVSEVFVITTPLFAASSVTKNSSDVSSP